MSRNGKNSDDRTQADLQAALNRLEKAIREFAAAAGGEFAGRAASFIDETISRLERDVLGKGSADARRSARRESGQESGQGGSTRRARRRRHGRRRRHREEADDRAPPGKLYRDPKRARIGGVCAGIANYFGAEVWVVRCVAVTGLIFMPSIVFPAYWILYFVLNPRPDQETEAAAATSSGQEDHSSPAPELGPQLSPRRSLRNLRAAMAQAELRLRRIESHVTSGRYELQKELNKLDGAGTGPDDRG